jgi:peptide/nickel transport system permease protein
MISFLVRRALYMVLTIWLISFIAFAVIQLPPGDYVSQEVRRMVGQGVNVTPEMEARLRHMYGLDQPGYVQYFKWVRNIVVYGTFGRSMFSTEDAGAYIVARFPMTFGVTLFSTMLVWIIALPIGIFSAVRQYTPGDYVFSFMSFIGLGVPNFLLALICLYVAYKVFGVSAIGLFSAEFKDAPWSLAKAWDMIKHMFIPGIVIGLGSTAGLVRTMRANLLDELSKPYVETARAKGLSERRLLLKYPVRHALNPFISTLGWMLPALVSGEVIVSIVLNLPTTGPVLYTALRGQDMFLAAGLILVLSSLTVVGTFVSDVLLAWLDPRIRLQ